MFDKRTGYMPITSLINHGVIVGSEDYSDEVAVDVDVNMTRYNGDIKQWWWNWKYWQHLLWWLIGCISGAWSSFATATSSFSEAGDQSSVSIWSAIKHLGHFTPSLGITNSHQGSFLPLPIVDWPTWMIFVNRLFLSPALFPLTNWQQTISAQPQQELLTLFFFFILFVKLWFTKEIVISAWMGLDAPADIYSICWKPLREVLELSWEILLFTYSLNLSDFSSDKEYFLDTHNV